MCDYQLAWKRSGVILIHTGLILLLAGELFTANFAREGQISLSDGEGANYTQDIRKVELAVTDPSPANYDEVTVVPESMLKTGSVVEDKFLPFAVTVNDYFSNSRPMGPFEPSGDGKILTVGAGRSGGQSQRFMQIAAYSGAGNEADKVDTATASVTLSEGGQTFGPIVLSQFAAVPAEVTLGAKTYFLDLRFRRDYKPYTLQLIHFSHDRFVGSELDKNFSSRVRLIDPSQGVDREALIWMNHPLRYRGETFYQQSFSEVPGQAASTTIQVVYNRGYWLPYAAVAIAALGMLIHFALHLVPFLRRRFSGGRTVVAVGGSKNNSLAAGFVGGGLNWKLWLPAGALAVACVVIVSIRLLQNDRGERGAFDLYAFSKIPVNYEGRPMPLDTLARIGLKVIHSSEILVDDKTGQTIPPIQWLMETMANPDKAADVASFRIG